MNEPIEPERSVMVSLQERIDEIFRMQKANRFVLARTSARERTAKLRRLLNWIYQNRPAIQQALYNDFRKPPAETDLTEIYVVISEIKHAIRHLRRWMKPHRVPPTRALLTTRAWIRYEPRGVVLIMSPWNFPFNLSLGPFVSALAAGNAMILKPSEFSPHTSRLIREMITALFPENEAYVFEGDRSVAAALLKKPFDHILFTGSTAVGKIVMKAAAEHLTTVTLELGGKSPVIVDKTADLNDAARKIAWGKYMNMGQTCIAPDYLLVHREVHDEFVALLKEQIQRTYGYTEQERLRSPDYSRVITPRHHQRLTALLHDSLEKGARIEIGGHTSAEERYIDPTVVTGVSPKSALMQEEIFGPILPVIRYDDVCDSLRLIHRLEKPLALYIFSRDKQTIDCIIANTRSGGVCINDVVLHFLHLNLPFGGINNSGHGNAHGFYGFRAFSHERAILKHRRYSPLKLLYPPYVPWVQKLINLTLKYL